MLKISGLMDVHDVFAKQDLEPVDGMLSARLAPHESQLLMLLPHEAP